MSQEYFLPKGKGVRRPNDASPDADAHPELNDTDSNYDHPQRASTAPSYMTVGNGSSANAARLQAMLEQDSGYGSMAGDDVNSSLFNPASSGWDKVIHEDRPMRAMAGHSNDADRTAQASAVHQLWYNQHRNTLGRAISTVVELLSDLQRFNETWPAHYPSVQRAALDSPSRPSSRPGFHQAYSTAGDLVNGPQFNAPHPPLRRAMTSLEDAAAAAESSRAAETRTVAEPRLVSPQIAQEFSVLKLDLKLGALHQTELVHSLEKGSVAALLDGKIQSSIRHLQALRERIEDTSSKVLVTGDLNAGKSTFCNALLRRKVLPEDQQPCTSIFCEVLDARENCGIEEVHAVHRDAIYNRHDEATYDVYPLRDLERIVIDNTVYMQCKVYVKDARSIDESLLNNGVVDIALIDAPGLNMDTTKTTAIFARQEEIDVVVFVVSAMNHFTQTGTEFIRAAAAEKAYLFVVVNHFDNIRDKDRCQKQILSQIRGLSPATYKEAGELVHFVSSTAIPVVPPPGGPGGGGGSGSSSGGGFGDDPGDNDPKGKGKDKEMARDFSALEQSLRRFVLEKRARSKLAPAKTYLTNILNDVNVLATVNTEVAQAEYDRVNSELQALEPQLEAGKRARAEISEQVDRTIEDTCQQVYDYSRTTINSAISHAGDDNLGIEYPGLFSAFQYADDLKAAMLSHIAASVVHCEENARKKTVAGVESIKKLGIKHLGEEYQNLNFKSEVMFQGRKDALARQVDISTEFADFVDFATLMQREEKAGMALTVAGVVGTTVISGYSQVNLAFRAAQILGSENLRKLIIPGVIAGAAALAFYVLSQIPHSLPARLSQKIATQLEAMDYVHQNSSRISGKVRKVLLIPANNLRVGLQKSVEQLGARRDETVKVRKESSDALRYFGNLVQRSAHQRQVVEAVDLDGHPPGMAGHPGY
ncbi:putative transmembrane GTPase FZO1 [Triangularia setosa]|uniref:Transmembrane GTPase FZO1 n=1 Tax=Triangularia setosa TaxID=2587417 RepID=A0AAN7A8Q0_9PEZI|nr:putative transmembrane GTPase FZO1 [Podospora setosa]